MGASLHRSQQLHQDPHCRPAGVSDPLSYLQGSGEKNTVNIKVFVFFYPFWGFGPFSGAMLGGGFK